MQKRGFLKDNLIVVLIIGFILLNPKVSVPLNVLVAILAGFVSS